MARYSSTTITDAAGNQSSSGPPPSSGSDALISANESANSSARSPITRRVRISRPSGVIRGSPARRWRRSSSSRSWPVVDTPPLCPPRHPGAPLQFACPGNTPSPGSHAEAHPLRTGTVPVVPVASRSTTGTPRNGQLAGLRALVSSEAPTATTPTDRTDDHRPTNHPVPNTSATTIPAVRPRHVTEPTKDPARTHLQVPLPGNLRAPVPVTLREQLSWSPRIPRENTGVPRLSADNSRA